MICGGIDFLPKILSAGVLIMPGLYVLVVEVNNHNSICETPVITKVKPMVNMRLPMPDGCD